MAWVGIGDAQVDGGWVFFFLFLFFFFSFCFFFFFSFFFKGFFFFFFIFFFFLDGPTIRLCGDADVAERGAVAKSCNAARSGMAA